MGVSGAGKTTVGRMLADRLGAAFAEGDTFHPAANVEKMRRGVPLDDADRWPWLDALARHIDAWQRDGVDGVLACSALRRVYRDRLRRPGVVFVHLDGPRETIAARLAARTHHYMPASLLDSQLQTLEPPGEGEAAITVGLDAPPETIVSQVLDRLAAMAPPPH